jgi:DNA invertase Pin-like site-specific DNA recombinase
MGKTITLNFDHLSPSDRKVVTTVATRAEENRKRIERNREIIRRLKNSNDSQKNIAKDFGITKQAVSLIKRAARITRPHAPMPGRPPKSQISS